MIFADLDELEKALEDILPPNFSFRTLKSGEVVIHTGLKENEDGELEELESEEEDEDLDPDGDLFDPLPDDDEDDDD